jgi:hypothetical protein
MSIILATWEAGRGRRVLFEPSLDKISEALFEKQTIKTKGLGMAQVMELLSSSTRP